MVEICEFDIDYWILKFLAFWVIYEYSIKISKNMLWSTEYFTAIYFLEDITNLLINYYSTFISSEND